MNYIDFLKNSLKVVGGYEVDEEGNVILVSGDLSKPFIINGIPLVLPTADNVTTALVTNANGISERKKMLFHPLYEDELSPTSPAFNKIKTVIEKQLSLYVYFLGLEILEALAIPEKEKELPLKLVNKLNSVLPKTSKKRKRLINEKTISTWTAIYKKNAKGTVKGLLHIFMRKGGKLEDGRRYTRSTVLKSRLLSNIEEALEDKATIISEIKTNETDLKTYKAIIGVILEGLDSVNYETTLDAPGFKSLMKLYLRSLKSFNALSEKLEKTSSLSDLYRVTDYELTIEDIEDSTEDFKSEIAIIPRINYSEVATTDQSHSQQLMTESKEIISEINSSPDDPMAKFNNINLSGGNTLVQTTGVINSGINTTVPVNNPVATGNIGTTNGLIFGQPNVAQHNPYPQVNNTGNILNTSGNGTIFG